MLSRFLLIASAVALSSAVASSPSFHDQDEGHFMRHHGGHGRHGYSGGDWYDGGGEGGEENRGYYGGGEGRGYGVSGGWHSHRGHEDRREHGGHYSHEDPDDDDWRHGDHPTEKHEGEGKEHASRHDSWKPRDGDWESDRKPNHEGWKSGEDDWGQHEKPDHHGRDRDDEPHHRGWDGEEDRGDTDDGNGEDPREGRDGGDRDDTPKVAPLSQRLRTETEAFVSGLVTWVNELVGSDLGASLVVDTTFSLTKSSNVPDDSVCSDASVKELLPVIRKAVEKPRNMDLLGHDMQAITWKPRLGCGASMDDHEATESEGGIFASVQITCAAQTLLNVSIAATGATPTIQSRPVEDAGLYLDVSIFDGAITAIDAQGSIVGVIKSRHFPENVDDVLKNWTALVQDCARRQQLDVRGAVGGGWTVYTPEEDAEDGYQTSAVGYAESFGLSFPRTSPQEAPATPDSGVAGRGGTVGFELLTTSNSVQPALAPRASIQSLARAASSVYVEAGLACKPAKSAGASCGSRVVMLELQSLEEASAALAYNTLPQHLAPDNASVISSTVVSAMGIVIVGVAAIALLTLRRRKGYAPLAPV